MFVFHTDGNNPGQRRNNNAAVDRRMFLKQCPWVITRAGEMGLLWWIGFACGHRCSTFGYRWDYRVGRSKVG